MHRLETGSLPEPAWGALLRVLTGGWQGDLNPWLCRLWPARGLFNVTIATLFLGWTAGQNPVMWLLGWIPLSITVSNETSRGMLVMYAFLEDIMKRPPNSLEKY